MSANERVLEVFRQSNVFTLQTRVTDILCYILVILGIIGNLLGLFIFFLSRHAWRRSPIYIYLAICSSITNFLCVIRYASVLHSRSRNILHDLAGHIWWACKIYEFSFSFRVISSWITLFWMFERLMCVSTRLRSFFNRWNSFKIKFIFPISIIIIILSCVIGPSVYMFQPQTFEYVKIFLYKFNFINYFRNKIINSTIIITKIYCGLNPNASIKWQKYFYEIHFGKNHITIHCLFTELIPTGTIILCDSYIVYHLIRIHQHLHRTYGYKLRKNQSQTTSWMNIVLILHSFLFLLSLFSHIVEHFINVEVRETWWVSLTVLINCSLNFYIYCLSGEAFRNEIRRFMIQFFYFLRKQQQHYFQYQKGQHVTYELHNFQSTAILS